MSPTYIEPGFLTRLGHRLSWREVAYGYKRGILSPEAVIEYADFVISQDKEPDTDAIAIAVAMPHEPITDKIQRLAKKESQATDESEIEYGWARILAAWVYETRDRHIDILGTVEEIYSDFGYPVELSKFVRYMPSNLPDLGSVQANEDRMKSMLGELHASMMAT